MVEKCRDLQVRSYGRDPSRFSGHVRVMQRPELVKMKKPAAVAAELGRQHSGERRKRMEATSGTRLMGRATYKGKLISGREKRGGHGVVISP